MNSALFNKIYDGVKNTVAESSKLTQYIFQKAIGIARSENGGFFLNYQDKGTH